MSKEDLINQHQDGVPDEEMPELKEEDFSRAKPNRFAKRMMKMYRCNAKQKDGAEVKP